MPELPEVETTLRGLQPYLQGQRIATAVVRNRALRQPIPRALPQALENALVQNVSRRSKYMLLDCGSGTLIVHLGMSGRLWVVQATTAPQLHDHFDLVMHSGSIVRLRDPRRFGLVLWHIGDVMTHPLLRDIGPEPLEDQFDAKWLHSQTRNRSVAIKNALMDSHLVAGVGNIYASEALYRSGINPKTAAQRLSLSRCQRLVDEVRTTLKLAIDAGGSSLRDYVGSDGMAGSYQNNFMVYGRENEPCRNCGTPIRMLRQGQRATYYCPRCQR